MLERQDRCGLADHDQVIVAGQLVGRVICERVAASETFVLRIAYWIVDDDIAAGCSIVVGLPSASTRSSITRPARLPARSCSTVNS